MKWKKQHIVSINDFSRDELIHILETAKKLEKLKNSKKQSLLKNKVVATLFFEPSTRTRLSFESAASQLGAKIIGFADPNVSSAKKGESLHDTIKMVEQYADIIVIRHNIEGAARLAAETTKKPVINAGDGANQHPTQTFLDLFTIKKTQKNITNLNVALVGDLKYGRTVHSLAVALSHFNCRLYFISPEILGMPQSICNVLKKKGIKFSIHKKIEEVIDRVDILYMTRIQKERFGDPVEYQRVKDAYILCADHLKNAKSNLKILHPLPRVNEINIDVDNLKYANYFEQAGNGILVRQAVLSLVAGAIK
ncbi:aspartate carbamoyltransferase [Candidatus Woesearchaeota archaeon CG10_big_fil_rev_8_21_14_0_10_34_8]|nr:MAG: aspartate carbamoyltransferase [Candidatus Woesearchaeota archaeon CG10_big_fil_rev_8_21_14_0_10_34_8]